MRLRTVFAVIQCAALVPAAHAAAFTDVQDGHMYQEAMAYIKEEGIAGGFPDGTFRPDRTVNRAEALKLIANAVLDSEEIERCLRERGITYTDVNRSDWFTSFVCSAAAEGILDADAQDVFRPADKITIAETAAMLTRAFGVQKSGEAEPWFAPYVRALGVRNAIPAEVAAAEERVTRGQLVEMIWRLTTDTRDREHANADTILNRTCNWFEQQDIARVDEEEVTRLWFSWVNAERTRNGLAPYTYDKQLSRTAALWSQRARSAGSITHKRDGQTAYYDYNMITTWFENLGLEFKSVNSTTFTENIGWGVFRCSAQDCTANMAEAIRTTFDMYMNEQTKQSRPHYNSMVHADFTRMGMGLAVDGVSGKYYLTTHYATAITSDPQPICP